MVHVYRDVCLSGRLLDSPHAVSVFIFILMNAVTKMNGHHEVIFIIIDHDNDDTVKGGSDGLVQSPRDK